MLIIYKDQQIENLIEETKDEYFDCQIHVMPSLDNEHINSRFSGELKDLYESYMKMFMDDLIEYVLGYSKKHVFLIQIFSEKYINYFKDNINNREIIIK